jgi:hypothetical protein
MAKKNKAVESCTGFYLYFGDFADFEDNVINGSERLSELLSANTLATAKDQLADELVQDEDDSGIIVQVTYKVVARGEATPAP